LKRKLTNHYQGNRKIGLIYLVSTLEYLIYKVNGNGSKLDPEELRTALAKVEPSLRKVYYKLN